MVGGITIPQANPRSRRESFSVFSCPALEVSWMSSSGSMPTHAVPFSIPIVAGTPPLMRTTLSRCDARAPLSGYGNPTDRSISL
jgi:hypothetical protein